MRIRTINWWHTLNFHRMIYANANWLRSVCLICVVCVCVWFFFLCSSFRIICGSPSFAATIPRSFGCIISLLFSCNIVVCIFPPASDVCVGIVNTNKWKIAKNGCFRGHGAMDTTTEHCVRSYNKTKEEKINKNKMQNKYNSSNQNTGAKSLYKMVKHHVQ